MAECIHGFDDGMCDSCFPKKAPELVTAAASAGTRTASKAGASRVGASRASASKVAAPRSRRVPGAPALAPNVAPFSTRRLYHVTHLRNLESILVDEVIRSVGSGATPAVDVAAPLVRQLRATADVGDGRTVAQFVPFILTPDADRWSELRIGATGSHWSAAARQTSPTEYVMLVVAANKLGTDVVVADGDASAPVTHFTIGDPAGAIVRAARTDPDLRTTEYLVADQVPLDALLLIGVPNEPMRTSVRRLFDAVDITPPKIVVHVPWFTTVPTEE